MARIAPVAGLLVVLLLPEVGLAQRRHTRPAQPVTSSGERGEIRARRERARSLLSDRPPVTRYQSRIEQLRLGLPRQYRNYLGILDIEPRAPSPITFLLDQRNALRGQSRLTQRLTTRVGRQYYQYPASNVPEMTLEEIQERPDLIERYGKRQQTPEYGKFADHLEAGLQKKAEDLFTLGRVYFHQKDFAKAGQQFEMLKVLERHTPRAYICCMMAAVERNDFNTAIVNLQQAIDRARTLDDLRIDRTSYYLKNEDFNATLQDKLMTRRGSFSSPIELLVAFYALQRNDLSTALGAIETAERYQPPAEKSLLLPDEDRQDELSAAKQFGDMIRAERNKTGAAPDAATAPAP